MERQEVAGRWRHGVQNRWQLPTLNTLPGAGAAEQRLLARSWRQQPLALPPAGSGLKPVLGDTGLPVIGHMIEQFRGGHSYVRHLYETRGPLTWQGSSILTTVLALGPDATQAVFANGNKDFSQAGWRPVIGPFFNRGLMLLDNPEHRDHRLIMQEAFTRSRLSGYIEHIDRVSAPIIEKFWTRTAAPFLLYPAVKKLTLDIASVVFMGHEPGSDEELLNSVNEAFVATTRAGGAILRFNVPGFKWSKGTQGRKTLERYFGARVAQARDSDGTDLLSVLCQASSEGGNRFADSDIVNHMIFLMMAAHDTTTSTVTSIVYYLAAHPEWQDVVRNECLDADDAPLDIQVLDGMVTLNLVMNEALRLVTPLPFNLRKTLRDTDLLGYHLPADTVVMTWPALNHRLPELWTDPDIFDPLRFSSPRAEHKRHRYAFSPFGGGAHKCIGMVFGQLEIKIIIRHLLRHYRIELTTPDYEPRWDYAGMPIPIDGMPVTLHPLT